ncbi:MAG TPA: GAF domain-containing protein, partial [Vicinamibacterales bacterium]|nr:GAF domain-containing protein [Vicinamibacterales bacterium]
MDPWSLTTALAAVEPDIWTTTPFTAVGNVRVAGDGRVRFEVRTRVSAAANLVDAAALPPVLRPAHAAGISVARLAAERDPERGVDRLLAAFGLDSIVRIPVGTADAPVTVFAALDDSRAIDDRDIDAVERIAHRAVALAAGGEPRAVRERRLARFDALSGVLRTLAAALDIRDVFDQLSTLTRGIIPHESSVVGVFEDDGGRVFRLHALSAPTGWTMPPVMRSQYPEALTHAWEFALHHDLPRHPLEHDRPIVKLGIQSAIRMPLYVGGVVRGILVFNARDPHSYTQDDVIVAKRVADYVALALSHQQLAEQAREAAAVSERAAHLELLDGLLRTLAGALDLRDVFARVSEMSGTVIAHDAMSVSVPSDDKQRLTIQVATGALGHLPTPFDQPAPAPRLLTGHWDYELVDDLPNHAEFHRTMATQNGM